MTQKGLEFTKSMAQGLEDVRIENGGRILYNGIARSVDKTAEQVCREFKKIADKEPDICKDPWKVLPVAVTWIGDTSLVIQARQSNKHLKIYRLRYKRGRVRLQMMLGYSTRS